MEKNCCRKVSLGSYVHSVGFIISSKVLKFVLWGKFSDMFEIAEQLVVHVRVVVQHCFVKCVPCEHPGGIVHDGAACCFFGKSCGGTGLLAL